MKSRLWGLPALGGACAVGGILLHWWAVAGIGGALLLLPVSLFAFPSPRFAEWTDVDTPERATRGDTTVLRIRVRIDGSRTWVSATDPTETARTWLPTSEPSDLLTWAVDTSRRGIQDVGPTRLEWADPFGLARRTLATRHQTRVLIVPRVHSVPRLPDLGFDEAGSLHERAGSEQFQSIREYHVGDPMKLVHWKASARTGDLVVRRMVDSSVPGLMIVLDTDRASYNRPGALFEDFDESDFEAAVELAASYAWANTAPGRRLIVTTTEPGSACMDVTKRSRESMLDWLATPQATVALQSGGPRIRALAKQHGIRRTVVATGKTSRLAAFAKRYGVTDEITLVTAG